jgi:adenylate kinase family enzyme
VNAPLSAPRRILVLGCAGSGKTRLARRLGDRLGVPVIDLDAMWASPAVDGDVATFRAEVARAHAGPAWVSDGNFSQASFDLRLPQAELIVWLEHPRWLCLWRAATRVLGAGEFHRAGDLRKVLVFIWNFDRINRPKIEAERQRHGPNVPLRRLAGDRQTAAFLGTMGFDRAGTIPPLPRTAAEEGGARPGPG